VEAAETNVDALNETSLPIRAKEDEGLILVDDEKKALALGAADSTASAEAKEAEADKALTIEDKLTATANAETKE
jgi:hypothetical protein